jgi:hypothetical protein
MIKRLCALALVTSTSWVSASASFAQSTTPDNKPISCMTGPVEQNYSRSKWAIYSCEDGASLAVVTQSGPAMPFVFFVSVRSGSVFVHGEGTGDKTETDYAYAALKALTPAQVADLVARTKAAATRQ